MSSAAQAFDQRSAAAIAQVVAELDSVPDSPSLAVGGLDFRAAQVAEDAKLAEQLQHEEYRKEEARTERRRQRQAAAATEQNASWTDWLMGTNPSSSASPSNASSSLASPNAARTASASGGGGARVAQPSSSIFACVAQSVSSVIGPPQAEVSGVDSTSLL